MPFEYEYAFYEFNKDTVIRSIKELGFKKKGRYLFRVQVFNSDKVPYARVRDEGFRTTLTLKEIDPETNFENEKEVIINDFDSGVEIMLTLGCTKKYYYEKIREIWSCKNDEIVFDTNPGEPDRMEIESKTNKSLDKLVKKLDLTDSIVSNNYDITEELYGFKIENISDLRFSTVKKLLGKLPTKNKKEFKKLIEKQLIMYNKIKN